MVFENGFGNELKIHANSGEVNSFKSCPLENTGPSDFKITTLTDLFCLSCSKSCLRVWRTCLDKAFLFAGLFIEIYFTVGGIVREEE